jgi:hypothetical protein
MAKGKGSRSQDYDNIDDWLKAQPRQERRGLRDSLAELRRLYRNRPEHEDFAWWHDVGSLVAKLVPKGGQHYGDNVIKLVAQDLEQDRKPTDALRDFLRKARDLAAKFSRKEASELTKASLKNRKPLSENHVKALLSVEDAEMRQQLLGECREASWSVRQLRRAIQNKKGRKSRSGGRPPDDPEPQEPGVALHNISVMSRIWLRNHKVWFGKRGCFSRRTRKRDRETILEDAESVVGELKEMQGAIKDGLEQLKSFIQELKGQ